jgi:uncharacterized protein (DUF433 family)
MATHAQNPPGLLQHCAGLSRIREPLMEYPEDCMAVCELPDYEPVAPPTAAGLGCGVWVRADICSGNPCVPARSILSFHCEGFTAAEIVEQCPTATVEQVNAAIRWNAEQYHSRREAKAERVAAESDDYHRAPAQDALRVASSRMEFIRSKGLAEEYAAWLAGEWGEPVEDDSKGTLPATALRGHG